MPARCLVTGKKVVVGNNVSHAKNRTKRTYKPNLQNFTFFSESLNRGISLRLATSGSRLVEKKGGIDAYLASTPMHKLNPELVPLKKAVAAALARKA